MNLAADIGPDVDLEAFYITSQGFPPSTTWQRFLCDSLKTLCALSLHPTASSFLKLHSVTSDLIMESIQFYRSMGVGVNSSRRFLLSKLS